MVTMQPLNSNTRKSSGTAVISLLLSATFGLGPGADHILDALILVQGRRKALQMQVLAKQRTKRPFRKPNAERSGS